MSNISFGGQSIHVGQKPKGIQFVVSNVFSLSVLLLGYIHFLEKKKYCKQILKVKWQLNRKQTFRFSWFNKQTHPLYLPVIEFTCIKKELMGIIVINYQKKKNILSHWNPVSMITCIELSLCFNFMYRYIYLIFTVHTKYELMLRFKAACIEIVWWLLNSFFN